MAGELKTLSMPGVIVCRRASTDVHVTEKRGRGGWGEERKEEVSCAAVGFGGLPVDFRG